MVSLRVTNLFIYLFIYSRCPWNLWYLDTLDILKRLSTFLEALHKTSSRVKLREHKFKHSFQDSINSLCSCSLDVESTIYYLVHCPLLTIERHTLLNTISQIYNKLLDKNESNLIQRLLLCDPSKDTETNNANTEILNANVTNVLAS